MSARRRLTSLTISALLLLVVAGCGTPPWAAGEVTASPSRTATPTPTPTPTPKTAAARNDLAKGSLKRTLTAGNVELRATYYSTLSMQDWTPAASKPLTLSLNGRFVDKSKQDIYLSKVALTIDVAGADGPLPGPDPTVDDASVTPGYQITAPTSYGQVFTIGALDPTAESITVNISYELLVQTAPKSDQYAKQAASDTMVIALRNDE